MRLSWTLTDARLRPVTWAYWLGVSGPCSCSTLRASRSKSERRTSAASPSSDHVPVSLSLHGEFLFSDRAAGEGKRGRHLLAFACEQQGGIGRRCRLNIIHNKYDRRCRVESCIIRTVILLHEAEDML